MTGTLEEKVERDVRAYPDDYRATGQWLDEFCSLKQHGSRLKGKLLLKKKEFDESGIQKEATKFKRKARTAGTKKARETAKKAAKKAAKKVGQRCQSRKDDLTKLKKQIRAVDAYLKTPKGEPPVRNSVLIKETWNNAYNEKPRDIKKILLIYWVLTDRLVDSDGPGLTRFEKWSYGDDRECAEPEEYFGTRHETLNEMISIDSKMIPTVEAAMRATTRNRETEQKVSGGKEEAEKTKKWNVDLANDAILPVIKEYGKTPNVLTARFLEKETGCPRSTLAKTKNWAVLKTIKKRYRDEQGKMKRKPVNLSDKMLIVAEKTESGTVKLHTSHKKKDVEGDD